MSDTEPAPASCGCVGFPPSSYPSLVLLKVTIKTSCNKKNLPADLLSVRDGVVDQVSVVGLLGSGEDQGGVGGGISGLVLGDGYYTEGKHKENSNAISLMCKNESM